MEVQAFLLCQVGELPSRVGCHALRLFRRDGLAGVQRVLYHPGIEGEGQNRHDCIDRGLAQQFAMVWVGLPDSVGAGHQLGGPGPPVREGGEFHARTVPIVEDVGLLGHVAGTDEAHANDLFFGHLVSSRLVTIHVVR